MTSAGAALVRVTLGALMVSYGISQMTRPRIWFEYLPYDLRNLLLISPENFMREHGLGNLTLGMLLLLNVRPEWLYWMVLMWWLSILPFAFYEDWRDGMRDVVIITSIIGLILYIGKQYNM